MKQKQLIMIIAAVIVLAVVVGGGIYFLTKGNPQKQAQAPAQQQEQMVQTLTPDQVGLQITIRPDKNAMQFVLNNAADITHVEYTITYTANQKGQEVNQGLFGEIDNANGNSSIKTDKYREFGTCSSGVCRYDTVVSPVKLTLKITKKDGNIYSVEKSVDLSNS
ncbi:MAG TPA: hypothetical protein VF820_01615 [Patescibacteria group bacterium]